MMFFICGTCGAGTDSAISAQGLPGAPPLMRSRFGYIEPGIFTFSTRVQSVATLSLISSAVRPATSSEVGDPSYST